MPLTQDQILEIKKFIHSRGFNTIEVEMEILDHVACAVEEKLREQPGLATHQAIESVHRSFGVLGFSVFEDELQKNLSAKLRKTFIEKIKRQLFSVNILKVLALALCIFILLAASRSALDPGIFKIVAYISMALLSSVPYLYHRKVFRHWKKKTMMIGGLVWPFAFTGLSTAYFIQFVPEEFISSNTESLNLILGSLSFIISLVILSTVQMVEEVYHWTHERWLKYQT